MGSLGTFGSLSSLVILLGCGAGANSSNDGSGQTSGGGAAGSFGGSAAPNPNGGGTTIPGGSGGAGTSWGSGGAATGGSGPPGAAGFPGNSTGGDGSMGGAPNPSGAGGDLGMGGNASIGGSSNAGGCCTGCICRSPTPPSASDLDKAGPYTYATFTIPHGTNHGGATVYYPTSATAPFAVAAFCPPYTATQVAFAAWGPFFASHGIVLATMDSVTTGDYPPQRALGLIELMGNLKDQNTAPGSPVNGKLATDHMGVLGWSMGGGAVWIASGQHPEWKSAVTLAGHNITATGWQQSAAVSTVPTMMLNGGTDTTIFGGMNQTQNAYATIPETTPKLMYIMSDLGHFDWGTPAAENNAAGRYVMAWEHTYLEGDERYTSIFLVKGPNAQVWQTNVQ